MISEKIEDILVEIGYELLDRGNSFRTKPLYRDSDSPDVLSIDKDSGVWYDHKERRGGKFEELVKISLSQKDMTETKEWIESRLPNGSQHHSNNLPKPKVRSIKKYPKELLLKLKKDHSYWAARGISVEAVETFNGGVASEGQMKNRYVFPIFNSRDEIVGFSGRYVNKIPEDFKIAKWKHIGSVSNWCFPVKYNLKQIQSKKEAILVESIGDMLALWNAGVENVVVTFGLTVSKAITTLLIKLDVRKVFISFNNDGAEHSAGNRAAREAAEKLYLHFDPNQIEVALPSKNDFGDMTEAEIKQWHSSLINYA
jgi:DNA primase